MAMRIVINTISSSHFLLDFYAEIASSTRAPLFSSLDSTECPSPNFFKNGVLRKISSCDNRVGPHVHQFHINMNISALPLSKFSDYPPLALDNNALLPFGGLGIFIPRAPGPTYFHTGKNQTIPIPFTIEGYNKIIIGSIPRSYHIPECYNKHKKLMAS
ncbi:hypothetical protein LguiA_002290 [Lonicera macranthoides]